MVPSPQRIVLGEVAVAAAAAAVSQKHPITTEVSFFSPREGLQMENHFMKSVSLYKIHTVQFLRSLGKGGRGRAGKGTRQSGPEACTGPVSTGPLSCSQLCPLGGLNSREIEELCLHGNGRESEMGKQVNPYSP